MRMLFARDICPTCGRDLDVVPGQPAFCNHGNPKNRPVRMRARKEKS